MTPRWRRAPNARVVEHREQLSVLGRDGQVRRFDGESATLTREVLAALTVARTRDELLAALSGSFDDVLKNAQVVDQSVQHLVAAGAVEALPELAAPPPRTAAAPPPRRLVLGLTGAVASSQAPSLLTVLQRRGYQVRTALTRAARRFVRPEALEAITHQPVFKGLWQRSEQFPAPHINLAEWAEVMLICPASATTLARLAAGDCSDLVSAAAIATRAPVVIAPSMNEAMYLAPSVQRNLGQLREDGFHLVQPGWGAEVAHRPELRAGTFGAMPAFDDVVAIVDFVVAAQVLANSEARARWDQIYRTQRVLPWHSDTLDDDLADALSVLPDVKSVVDLGTGQGTVARELARRGYQVTATDVSAVALERARVVCLGHNVELVHDDLVASALKGPFDLVLDRGVLHTMPRDKVPQYLAQVARLTRPGSHLLLKVHSASEPRDWQTTKYGAEQLEALFEPTFEVLRIVESSLPGPVSPHPQALLGVFRRKA